jgi:adenosine deaminase
LFKQLVGDGVIYVEIRFAPLLHTREGLSAKQVVEVVCESVEKYSIETGIQAGIILCTLRHYSEQQSMETVQLVDAYQEHAVCGFDLAADEAKYSVDSHIAAFQYAKENGLNRTVHAGEARGPNSVWETLKHLQPQRIGHGVRSVEDESLLDHLKQHNIHLEVCPTSNIQTDVFDEMSSHSLPALLDKGISVGINTDGRGLSNVTLSDEYQKVQQFLNITTHQLWQCNRESIRHAFTTEKVKNEVTLKLDEAYQAIIQNEN